MHRNRSRKAIDSFLVYLRATPETCLERIQARHRSEEASIDLVYLQTLHQHHEDWLVQGHGKHASTPPVLIVDANQTKERVYTDTNAHVNNLVSC
jgi:deoxyadenosine/deoxycytidine kinase